MAHKKINEHFKQRIVFETIGMDKKKAKKLKSLFYAKLKENEKEANST